MAQEYRIDYNQYLTIWRAEEVTLEALAVRIRNGDFLWKHNVYPSGFTLSTITKEKRPQTALVERIRAFLLDHAKPEGEAFAFAQAGDTKFLKDCRRFKPAEYEERLLARLA